MAKKQYLSPEVEVNALSCEDVLTSSGEGVMVKGDTIIGSFNSGWFTNN